MESKGVGWGGGWFSIATFYLSYLFIDQAEDVLMRK